MSLSAGTTLKDNQYQVQSLAYQSDFGVTYQAVHLETDQPVWLQTFNEVVTQRGDFPQLQQQFLDGVDAIAQYQPDQPLQVLDCFKEAEMPYLVLAVQSKVTPPKLQDWLPLSPQPEMPVSAVEAVEATEVVKVVEATETEGVEAVPAETPQQPAKKLELIPAAVLNSVTFSSPKEEAVANRSAQVLSSAPPQQAQQKAQPPNPFKAWMGKKSSHQSSQVDAAKLHLPKAKARHKVPVGIVLTALIAGGFGIGIGAAMRFEPAAPSGNTPQFGGGLFGSEQSFPPRQNWPVSEDYTQFAAPNPNADQPLYRTNPYLEDGASPLPSISDDPYAPPLEPDTPDSSASSSYPSPLAPPPSATATDTPDPAASSSANETIPDLNAPFSNVTPLQPAPITEPPPAETPETEKNKAFPIDEHPAIVDQ
jgi:hypothetical protein